MADEKKEEVIIEKKEEVITPPTPAPEKKEETRDYKAELEAKEKELGQAQHTIVTLKKEKKGEKNNKEDEGGDEEEGEEIDEVVDEKLEKFKLEITQDTLQEELNKLSDNPDKLKLIKLYYDTRIVKSGFSRASIQEDLAIASAIVDKPRQDKIISEMKQSKISDNTKNNTGSTTGQEVGNQSSGMTEEMLTPTDRKIMARHGLTLKDINNKK